MKIAFFELEGWEEPRLRKEFVGQDLFLTREALTAENARGVRDVEVASIFIGSRVDRAVLDELPNLKAIVTRSAGVDHIDVEACRERGISVYNVPDYGPDTIAEHTLMLILMLARRVKELELALRKPEFKPVEMRGWELKGKTIGVVGTGRIGSRVAKLALALGMRVLAYDVVRNEELERTHGVQYVDLDTLLSSSDVITLHLPLTPQTRYLINRGNIRKVKRGALLVNTARGELVEVEALIEALDEGLLAGAALDVVEGEWVFSDAWRKAMNRALNQEQHRKALLALKLASYPNVILTPHVAYNTWEAVERIWDAVIATVKKITEKPQLIAAPGNAVALASK